MAEVFLGRASVAQGLNKQLVIKKIHRAYARSRHFVTMFRDEASIALELNHPNVVQVFDFGQVGDTYFLVMEYVEGLDLLRLMHEAARANRRIPLGLCAYIVQQVAKGLDYAHRKTDEFGEPLGIVHRDISPQNVLLSWDGGVKIVDFGIARARTVHEEEGVVKGKLAYMSPEQARGDAVDRRADVYSAGVVLFEVCCGRPLFPGKGKEVLEAVKAGAITRPRDCNKEIPPELEETIVKSLSFHPSDRFQTGRDMQSALAQFHFHLAQVDGQLIDSQTLAQFVSQVVPAEQRRTSRRPPTVDPLGDSDVDRDSADLSNPRIQTRTPVRERKHVFVVAGQVTGVGALEARVGEAAAKSVLSDFFKVATDIAFKEEAIIHETDDSRIVLVVGLPAASESDATRTIRLAKMLVEALDGIGLDVEPEVRLAVGIQRGVAILKSRKGDELEYDLGSSTTQIASLLAGEAHGAEILCGGSVYRAAKDEWHFERLTTIDLPGETDSGLTAESAITDTQSSGTGGTRAHVYRLRGPKDRAQRIRERARQDIDLIGRELELKSIRDAYRQVATSGQRRQVAIIGDAGLGKRALLSAFLATVGPNEAIIFRAVGRSATSRIPFGIIGDLSRDFLGLPDGADPAEIRKRAGNVFKLLYPDPATNRESAAMLQAAYTVLGARTDANHEMDAGERRELLRQMMVKVEQGLPSDKPLILLVEDVHYADSQSMELFVDLVKQPSKRGVFAILTSRQDDVIVELAEEIGAELIHLEELSPEDAMRLVKRRFVPGEAIDDLAAQIVSRAGGNPLFITEMVDSLIARSILLAEPEGSEFEGLYRWSKREAPLQIPSSIEALLVTKIDRLPETTKHAVMHAAILGRRFEKRPLETLLGGPVAADLDELCKRGLIVSDGGDRFQFKSELAMSVAYQLVPDEERTGLHRAIANEMAESSGYQRGKDDAVIARHLELAGDSGDAADRYLAAAAHAVDVGGNTDAFRQLTRALKLIPPTDHQRRFVARLKRAEILRRLSRKSAELREIENLLKEAEGIGEPKKLAIAGARLAAFYVELGKIGQATRAVSPALEHARESGDVIVRSETLRLKGDIDRLEGRYDDSISVLDEALALLTQDSDATKRQRALILNSKGHVLWKTSRLSDAIDAYAEALVVYQFLRLPRDESRLYNNMGVVFAAMGELEQALANYKSALKLDQRLGDRYGLAMKLGNIGQAYADVGDLVRGERYLRKARAMCEKNDDATTLVDVQTSLGQVFLAHGKYQEARELLEKSLGLARELHDRYQETRALIYLAMAILHGSEKGGNALDLALEATEIARSMPMPVGEYYGLAVAAMALGARGHIEEALRRSRAALEVQRDTEQPEGALEIAIIHAELCAQAGEDDEATEHVLRANELLQKDAERLEDPVLRQSFVDSDVAQRITRLHQRLIGSE